MHLNQSKDTVLIYGSSHHQLAVELSNLTGIPLFDSTQNTKYNETAIAGKHVFILQTGKGDSSHCINWYLLELLSLVRMAKQNNATRITLIIPCFPYARQDKQQEGLIEPISAKLIAKMIESAGATELICVELHSSQIQGFFDIPVDVLSVDADLARYIQNELMTGKEGSFVIVSPDVGGVSRAIAIGEMLQLPVAVIYKERRDANKVSKMLLVGQVEGRIAVIVDDMIDTCGTLSLAAHTLIGDGRAKEVYAIAVHGILSGNAEVIITDSPIKSVIIANTVSVNLKSEKIKCFSIAPLLADAVQRSIYSDHQI